MRKIAIVFSEGGMSCAYSVGVVKALVEKYNFTEPYLAIGSSGSTGTLSYYVAGQYKEVLNIWENLLSAKKFINLKRLWRLIDIDYLIDEVFKKQEVLNVGKVRNSQTKLLVTATDANSGEAVYFSNGDGVDWFEVLRASSAMPIAFGKRVKIDGGKYLDGAIAAPLGKNIQKAFAEGAEFVIAVNNSNPNDFFTKGILRIYSYFISKKLGEKLRGNYSDIRLEKPNENVLMISPTRILPISTLDNKKSHIKETIQIGYNDACENEGLKKWLAG